METYHVRLYLFETGMEVPMEKDEGYFTARDELEAIEACLKANYPYESEEELNFVRGCLEATEIKIK